MLHRICNVRILDPTASPADRVGDLWIDGDRLVAAPAPEPAAIQNFDATGCIAMAGSIDMHTHIGGGKVTLARMLMGDQMPPWRGEVADEPSACEFLPAASVTADRYLDMGYTTCFEPAMIPCNARSAHAEMADVCGIDTGGYCLLGNDEVLMRLLADGHEQPIINDYVAWMVRATQAIAVKVVNPGGIDAFKYNARAMDVDTPHPKYSITPGHLIRTLCRAVYEIGLVHPLHVHCSNLGVPGNIASTLATIVAADGYPIHITHAQFHCYGDEGPYRMSSGTEALIDAMRKHPNVTIDVGQIQFGRTVTISADAMHQTINATNAKPRKSILLDIECEAGCGVVPFRYQRRQFVHCLQWAIGLELFLMSPDPSRVFLTTDHPNGAPFTAYPHLIRLLGDHSFRETALAEIHPEAAAATQLAGLNREYSLEDIATMTRSAPANILGLHDRGHLRPGGQADIVVYEQNDNLDQMFRVPRWVFKRGRCIRDRGKRQPFEFKGDQTLVADLIASPEPDPRFRDLHQRHSTFAMNRLRIDDAEIRCVTGTDPIAFPTVHRS